MLRTILGILVLSMTCASSAHGQQLPDKAYRPPLNTPTWAVAAGPDICVDEAHHNFHTLSDRFWAFGELLRQDGYVTIASTHAFDAQGLSRCGVMVIANAQLSDDEWDTYPYPTPSGFTTEEIGAVHGWVRTGGSLLLIADHMPLAGVAGALASRFGVEFNNGFAVEGIDAVTGQPTTAPTLFRGDNRTLAAHPIARGRNRSEAVTQVRSFTGQAFRAPSAAPVLVLGKSFMSLMPERPWQFGPQTIRVPVGGWLQGATMTIGAGRAAFFGEAAMFSAQVAGAARTPAGMNAPLAEQNFQFVLNVLHWLSGELR